MGVDWGQAAQIAGIGFGTVFLVLTILAVAILLVARAVGRISRGKDSANGTSKGD